MTLERFDSEHLGMIPTPQGVYCLVADVSQDLKQAVAYRSLNMRLKKLGQGSIEELVERLETEAAARAKATARIEVEAKHRQFFNVPEGEDQRGFVVVRTRGDYGQLQVDDKMEIWVAFYNHTPKARTLVFLDDELHIKRITHL